MPGDPAQTGTTKGKKGGVERGGRSLDVFVAVNEQRVRDMKWLT